jgi:hypothetical protein
MKKYFFITSLAFIVLNGCKKIETTPAPQVDLINSTDQINDTDQIKTSAVNNARKFYIDPSSTASLSNGSFTNPFKSITQVNAIVLYAGDSVFFKNGQVFSGALNIKYSGTITDPIVYTNYGSGLIPVFNNAFSNVVNFNTVKYVVLNGIKITDYTMNPSDRSIPANVKYAINLNNSTNCTISNMDISLVGVGISVGNGSNGNRITRNNISNLRMIRNTPTTINANDDYGANPMVIQSSNNMIDNNYFKDCWATSYDYGFDGGAVELYGTNISNNKIIYNTAIDCNGFVEVGSATNGTADGNVVAYNKIINCGSAGTFQTSGTFAVKISRFQYYNNNFIETVKQFAKPSNLFYSSLRTPPTGMLILRNNIFWLSSGVNAYPTYLNNASVIHSNNIYRMAYGVAGITLNNSELYSKTLNIFTAISDSPIAWNYALLPTTPAVNFGVHSNVGLTKDFHGKSIVGNPDAGILELQ